MQAKNKTPKPILSQVGKFEQDGKKYVSVPVGTYVSKSAYSIKIAEIKKDYANKLFMFELKKNYSDYLADRYKDISEQTFKRLMYMTNKKIWAYEQITLNEQKLSTQTERLNRLSKEYNELVVENGKIRADWKRIIDVNNELQTESNERKSIIQKLILELQASTDKCKELELCNAELEKSHNRQVKEITLCESKIDDLRTSGLMKLIVVVILGLSFLATLVIHLFDKHF